MKKIALSLAVVVIVAVVVFFLRSGNNKGATADKAPARSLSDKVKQASSTKSNEVLVNAHNGRLDAVVAPVGSVLGSKSDAVDGTALTNLNNVSVASTVNAQPQQPRINQPANIRTAPVQSGGSLYLRETERVANLGVNLARVEVERLYEFLKSSVDVNPDMDPVEVNSVKNDIMDKLLAQEVLPDDLGGVLVDLYANRSNDELLRNYGVQHFELFLQQKVLRGEFDPRAPDIVAVRNAYLSALEEKHNSLAGVALLGMERATEHDPLLDRDLIAGKALQYAADPNADRGTRIAAVQVCGAMKVSGAKSTLRTLINETGSIPLQLAAIHALGEVGDESDVDRLNELALAGGRFARVAASRAAANISSNRAK